MMGKSRKRRRSRPAKKGNAPPAAEPQPASISAEASPSAPPAETAKQRSAGGEITGSARDRETRQPPPSRRGFFREAWLALGSLAVLEFLWVVITFLRPRPDPDLDKDGVIIAGPATRFERGTVTAFQRGKFYLARLEEGGFLALSRECTHLGCTVPWVAEEGRFICPCHSSAYDIRGVVVSPPAPRPLDLFPIRIENGVVIVDPSEPIRRRSFDEAQVTES